MLCFVFCLQLQHSLEAQIAALMNNLQVLQQNHNRQQEIQDKVKEQRLQQQLEERLKRLEDLQAKILEAQVCIVKAGGGYAHKIPIFVCVVQHGWDLGTPDLE